MGGCDCSIYLQYDKQKTFERHFENIGKNRHISGTVWPIATKFCITICYEHIWTTREEYSVVFITVQNFMEIDAVVSITCKCWYLSCLAWKCLFTPKLLFWKILPHKCRAVTSRLPKVTCLCKITSYNIQIVKIGPPVFAQLISFLPNPRNPMLCNGLETPLKVPVSV